jgi:hypothetical protein
MENIRQKMSSFNSFIVENHNGITIDARYFASSAQEKYATLLSWLYARALNGWSFGSKERLLFRIHRLNPCLATHYAAPQPTTPPNDAALAAYPYLQEQL